MLFIGQAGEQCEILGTDCSGPCTGGFFVCLRCIHPLVERQPGLARAAVHLWPAMKPSAPAVEHITRFPRDSNSGCSSKERRVADQELLAHCGEGRHSNISKEMKHGLATRMLLLLHGDREDRQAAGRRIHSSLAGRGSLLSPLRLLSHCNRTCSVPVFSRRISLHLFSKIPTNRRLTTHSAARACSRMASGLRPIPFFRPPGKMAMLAPRRWHPTSLPG